MSRAHRSPGPGPSRLLFAAAVALCFAAPLAAQDQVDPTEASLRVLQRAVAPQRDGSHLSLLFALRQLRDPDLQPLFQRLVAHSQWQVQVHGVLGLAEISPNSQVDTSIIASITPEAQDAVIATSLDLELLPPDKFDALLAIDDLPPMSRLVLLAEKVLLGEPVDVEQVRPLLETADHHIASLAACLLAQRGEPAALDEMRSRMSALNQRRRLDLQLWLIEAIRRYRLTAGLEWVVETISQPAVNGDTINRAIFTILELDPERGLNLWKQHLGPSPSYQQRVRYGMMLLASGTTVPTAAYDQLKPQNDEELLNKMVAVGRALSSDADPALPLIELLSLSHLRTTEWAMQHATKLPQDQARSIYVHLLDRIDDRAAGETIAVGVTAATRLFRIDPDHVLQKLRDAPDDGVLQQAILLALFEIDSPTVGTAAGALRRIGSGRADSLALLLIAKHSRSLPPDDIKQLGMIAAGGGRISNELQVQAAWMFLKHTGRSEVALARLFPPSD